MRFGGRNQKPGRSVWVCPYLSPECGERGLKNQGCSLHARCHYVIDDDADNEGKGTPGV